MWVIDIMWVIDDHRAQTRLTDSGSEDLAGASLLLFGGGLVVEEGGFSVER